jgi:hypothetical protein
MKKIISILLVVTMSFAGTFTAEAAKSVSDLKKELETIGE